MLKMMMVLALLSGCVGTTVPIETDRAMQLQYLQDVSERKAFRPEVYAESEFLSDCEEFQMEECYN